MWLSENIQKNWSYKVFWLEMANPQIVSLCLFPVRRDPEIFYINYVLRFQIFQYLIVIIWIYLKSTKYGVGYLYKSSTFILTCETPNDLLGYCFRMVGWSYMHASLSANLNDNISMQILELLSYFLHYLFLRNTLVNCHHYNFKLSMLQKTIILV